MEQQFDSLMFTTENLYQVLEAMPSAVLVVDTEGMIAFLNMQAEKLFGYSRSELLGRSFELLMPERYRGSHGEKFDGYRSNPSKRPMGQGRDLPGLHRDGYEIPLEIGLNSLELAGKPYMLATIADITGRKLGEKTLRAKNEELKTFAYTVSHDLKAPLRGIAGYAQELERRFKDDLPERAQFCISQILTASANMDRLIEDLLKYSRIESDMPSLTEVDIAATVNAILHDYKHILGERAVEVSLDIKPFKLVTWERGLRQILSNLVDNAIKYSRDAQAPRLSITAQTVNYICRVTVSDNGIGFDMKYHDRIFGLFNRLVRANEFEGTGAGLAIVRKVIEKLGGSIRAESSPGQGASFIIELPVNNARG